MGKTYRDKDLWMWENGKGEKPKWASNDMKGWRRYKKELKLKKMKAKIFNIEDYENES